RTGFRHGYVQKIYASIRATDPAPVDGSRAIEIADSEPSNAAAPAAHMRSRVPDAARIASTWPATVAPANPVLGPVMAQASSRAPVRVSLAGPTEPTPAVDGRADTSNVAALPPTVAGTVIEPVHASMDAAFVF